MVNFDLHFGPRQLLLGLNGTGKTSVFDALNSLCSLVGGFSDVNKAFPAKSLTRWQRTDLQTFELELSSEVSEQDYKYSLQVQHTEGSKSKIKKERLQFGEQLLFDRSYAEAQLYRDDGSKGPQVLSDWSRSSLYQINPRPENMRLTAFKAALDRLYFFQLDPWAMSGKSTEEALNPDADLGNFASWFRHLLQEKSREMYRLQEDLRAVLGEGFEGLRLASHGDTRQLVVDWRVGAAAQPISYEFNELSEGQRLLIGLYTLIHAFSGEETTLCMDEADNFIALSEVQPWLNALAEQSKLQVLLISHHPELIDQLAPSCGLRFQRSAGGPVRVAPFSSPPDETLTAAQLVARGWDLGAP